MAPYSVVPLYNRLMLIIVTLKNGFEIDFYILFFQMLALKICIPYLLLLTILEPLRLVIILPLYVNIRYKKFIIIFSIDFSILFSKPDHILSSVFHDLCLSKY